MHDSMQCCLEMGLKYCLFLADRTYVTVSLMVRFVVRPSPVVRHRCIVAKRLVVGGQR